MKKTLSVLTFIFLFVVVSFIFYGSTNWLIDRLNGITQTIVFISSLVLLFIVNYYERKIK